MNPAIGVGAGEWPAGLEHVPCCPVCAATRHEKELGDLPDRSFGSAPGIWGFKRCLECRALYLDPRPDPASIHLAYRNYYTHARPVAEAHSAFAQLRRAIGNGYRNRILHTSFKPSLPIGALVAPLFPAMARAIRREGRGLGHARGSQRLLDVGCGNGQFLRLARELGWLAYGVEMDTVAAAVARDHGSEILGSTLEDLGPSHEQFFDLIMLSHVIEHAYDPTHMLRQCWRLLKPGGYVWIETPNIDSVGYELYGSHWRGLEPPRHLVLFNFASLRFCLERTGFERIQGLTPPYVADRTFELSAAMRLGRIADLNTDPLPPGVRKEVRLAALKAKGIARANPEKGEYVNAIAYRPGTRDEL